MGILQNENRPWALGELAKTLSALYYTEKEISGVLIASGLNPGDYEIGERAALAWILIVNRLDLEGNLNRVLDKVLEKHPNNLVVQSVRNNTATYRGGVYTGPSPTWRSLPPGTTAEQLTRGQSTLLPIAFLEMGWEKAKAVARITTPKGQGTGFIISYQRYFMTNNHVFPSMDVVRQSVIEFNYQKDQNGKLLESRHADIDDTFFETSKDEDWTLIKLKDDTAKAYGIIAAGTVSIQADEFVNIIQHPGGEDKQIGLYHNVVTSNKGGIVQYLTDTLPGSSGSPVCNSAWQVVALHHSGTWEYEGDTLALRNEGTDITVITRHLEKRGITL